MGLRFSYDYRVAEQAAAASVLRDVLYPRGSGMLGWISLALPPSIAALAGSYLVTAGGFSILLAILLVGISFWLGLLLYAVASEREVSRMPSLASKQGMVGEIELLDEGIRQASRDGETMLRWTAFHQALERDGTLYLVVSGTALVIPARAFSSPDERREAIDWIYPRLTKEAQARSAGLNPKITR